jgi:WhiB family transcriptional regulator, redox-sensing transcriptional regulator
MTSRPPVLAPLLPELPAWMDRARCVEHDPELWHPERGQSPIPAKRICGDCEVKTACARHALANPGLAGVYGGLTERERGQMRRRARERRERAS